MVMVRHIWAVVVVVVLQVLPPLPAVGLRRIQSIHWRMMPRSDDTNDVDVDCDL